MFFVTLPRPSPFQSSWCPGAPGLGIGNSEDEGSLISTLSGCTGILAPPQQQRAGSACSVSACFPFSSDTSNSEGPFSPTAAVWSLLSHPSAWTVSLGSDGQRQSCQGEQKGQRPIPNCAPRSAVEPSPHLPVDCWPPGPEQCPGTAGLPSTSPLSPWIPWLPAVSISVGYMSVHVSKSETLAVTRGEVEGNCPKTGVVDGPVEWVRRLRWQRTTPNVRKQSHETLGRGFAPGSLQQGAQSGCPICGWGALTGFII